MKRSLAAAKQDTISLHRAHAWQPFTQMKLSPDPFVVERAAGSLLYTEDGREIIDAVGSWWTSVHGHNHPRIVSAVKGALDRLDHVMYAGFTHPDAALLSAKLAALTGNALPRVFFSDNGSTAVEIALKMAFQCFANAGQTQKCEFITLENGYHGDTIGTMSVGARSVFHQVYEPLLFDVHTAPSPKSAGPADVAGALDGLSSLLKQHSYKICGMILEPLIQGAGGMRMHHPSFLKGVRELCSEHDVFMIADEVFTGCGRTGTFFACEQAGVWPDLIALSKGLSGGMFAFAATLASDRIFSGFHSENRVHTLFHGHSMTGSALGCAASLASLDIFEEEATLARVRALEETHKTHVEHLRAGPLRERIREARVLGSVAAIDLEIDGGYLGEFAPQFGRRCAEKGVLLRPLGNVLYFTPPFNISQKHLDVAYEVLEETAAELLS